MSILEDFVSLYILDLLQGKTAVKIYYLSRSMLAHDLP